MAAELTTVGPDVAVVHDGTTVRRYEGLAPGTVHVLDGMEVRTLPDPGGELLCRVATVNDVHFGETVCGMVQGAPEIGPVLSVGEDETPYPITMNVAAATEIASIAPSAVVAKGDLTANGTFEEYRWFLDVYGGTFGGRLHHVRGNHDASHGAVFADDPTQAVELPGVVLAILDTTIPGAASGTVSATQLEWLDTLAAEADVPVLVFGHHHAWNPDSPDRSDDYYGIHPDASEALVAVAARRPSITGYFAGHTHRNRVRRFSATGEMPWVEVACVKDYPGAWAEYRIHEGGIVQLLHRVSTPEALAWTERTREMFDGGYAGYAFGTLADRCFPVAR